jgi:hypothetical protein
MSAGARLDAAATASAVLPEQVGPTITSIGRLIVPASGMRDEALHRRA